MFSSTRDEGHWMIFKILCLQPETVPQLTAESTMDDVWSAQMISFIHHAQATLKFAKKIPGQYMLSIVQ